MSQIKSKSTLSKSFKALGKQCRITAENIADNGEDPLQLAINELHRIEEKFCKYKNDSLITKINRRAGLNHPTPLDEEARSLIRFVDAMHKKSNGSFDPTINSLKSNIDGKESKKDPSTSHNGNLSLVGWENLTIDDAGARLIPMGTSIELNSCISAYALDCVRNKLVTLGVEHALIEIGNSATAIGKHSDGSNWLVGLRHSMGAGGGINRIKLNGQSLVICGKIEKTISVKGERFGGARDPFSGNFVPGMLVCATKALTALEAYSAAKLCWVQPEKDGLELLESLEFPFFVIDRSLNCYGELNSI